MTFHCNVLYFFIHLCGLYLSLEEKGGGRFITKYTKRCVCVCQRYFSNKIPKFLMGKNNLFLVIVFFGERNGKIVPLFTFCCCEKYRGGIKFFLNVSLRYSREKHWAINLNWKRKSRAREGTRFKITFN